MTVPILPEVEDCAAALENMMLAVTALGYATVWIDEWLRAEGPAAAIGELPGVPPEKVVRVMLPIGVATQDYKRPVKMAFEQRAWFNKYGQEAPTPMNRIGAGGSESSVAPAPRTSAEVPG